MTGVRYVFYWFWLGWRERATLLSGRVFILERVRLPDRLSWTGRKKVVLVGWLVDDGFQLISDGWMGSFFFLLIIMDMDNTF